MARVANDDETSRSAFMSFGESNLIIFNQSSTGIGASINGLKKLSLRWHEKLLIYLLIYSSFFLKAQKHSQKNNNLEELQSLSNGDAGI